MSISALADAIIAQDAPRVQQLLCTVNDLNELDPYGYTPLIQAGIVNNTDIARLLLSHKADPNKQDMTGNTPLHWAAENNNLDLAKLLLEYKADPNLYTTASQSPLVMPYLRKQYPMLELLTQAGGSQNFARNFVNTKLMGHRFSLLGSADIVDPKDKFTEVNLEGFYLEFSVGIMYDSLLAYIANFAAKDNRFYFNAFEQVIDAFATASQLVHYQQYMIDVEKHTKALRQLTYHDLLVLPVGYEGHAITLVKYHNLLVICNRRRTHAFADQLLIYRMDAPDHFDWPLIKHCLYERNSAKFIETELARYLQCTPISRLFIKRQITGNCSWANMEAAVPVCLFFLLHDFKKALPPLIGRKHPALSQYRKWLSWDQDRALSYFIQSFEQGDEKTKAASGALLAATLFQRCGVKYAKDRQRARRIIKTLDTPGYEYLLESYQRLYKQERLSDAGKNLNQMIKTLEDPFE